MTNVWVIKASSKRISISLSPSQEKGKSHLENPQHHYGSYKLPIINGSQSNSQTATGIPFVRNVPARTSSQTKGQTHRHKESHTYTEQFRGSESCGVRGNSGGDSLVVEGEASSCGSWLNHITEHLLINLELYISTMSPGIQFAIKLDTININNYSELWRK